VKVWQHSYYLNLTVIFAHNFHFIIIIILIIKYIKLGDFNASWGDHLIDQRGRKLMEAMDELDFTHLNDGTLTMEPCPRSRGSAVNLSLTSGRTRLNFDWTVLDDSAASDHNPIFINLSGLSNIRLPLRPPSPNPRILDWRCYANANNESFSNMTIDSGVSVDTNPPGWLPRWGRDPQDRSSFAQPGGAANLMVGMKGKWNFFGFLGDMEWTDNFNAYRVVNEELTELCEKLKPESFKQYCSTLNCHSSLREMYDMARRYCRVPTLWGSDVIGDM
jgi:hypothetical protein